MNIKEDVASLKQLQTIRETPCCGYLNVEMGFQNKPQSKPLPVMPFFTFLVHSALLYFNKVLVSIFHPWFLHWYFWILDGSSITNYIKNWDNSCKKSMSGSCYYCCFYWCYNLPLFFPFQYFKNSALHHIKFNISLCILDSCYTKCIYRWAASVSPWSLLELQYLGLKPSLRHQNQYLNKVSNSHAMLEKVKKCS